MERTHKKVKHNTETKVALASEMSARGSIEFTQSVLLKIPTLRYESSLLYGVVDTRGRIHERI